eukprot:TRINITY_DN8624_c0_g2_i1.p1 TRINITY_DN8624_c0_g2~~TRINITY_DN8624_c0_g2_i1.p1  ORF type:complete len:285 (+),score=20.56 TRINITY_DN8624_c0_g2_i1:63-917(+)
MARGGNDACAGEASGVLSRWLSAGYSYAKPTIGVASNYARQACDGCEDLPVLGRAARLIGPHVTLEAAQPFVVDGEPPLSSVAAESDQNVSSADSMSDTVTWAEVRSEVEFCEPEFEVGDFDLTHVFSLFWTATRPFREPLQCAKVGVTKGKDSVKSFARDSSQRAVNVTLWQCQAAGAAFARTLFRRSTQLLVRLVRTSEAAGLAPWQGVLVMSSGALLALVAFALVVFQVILASVSILAIVSALAVFIVATAVVVLVIGGKVSSAVYRCIVGAAVSCVGKTK